MKNSLRIAGCQFPVEADISFNRDQILGQIQQAASQGARLVHFSEAALSGYAGVDFPDISHLDWEELRAASEDIMNAAARHGVWVLLGSTHPLSDEHRPHNSVYVIDDQGVIVERYDKRFCTGRMEPECELDLLHYSPGNHATIFEIDGYRCAILICYDYRFPELYRDLQQQGVEIVFQSFHNARRCQADHEAGNIWKDVVPATMMCRAATNHLWISATNSAAKYSCWGNFFVRPNGTLAGQLPVHESDILFSNIDPQDHYWDASAPWRDRSIQGQLHSGELVQDPRSTDRQSL
ncbi:MAG: carbon-nitrogen hydrolase family protein [Planctomycetaceae bacterium]|nr:carbon-nitrogen hydrolase family protein [Planctomycetaceae bacterium]